MLTLKKSVVKPALQQKAVPSLLQPLKKKTLSKSTTPSRVAQPIIKIPTSFRPKVRSRHPSHSVLRTQLPLLPFKSVVRLGSTTEVPDTLDKGGRRIECNSIESIKNSASKLRMKECFTKALVKTAKWTRDRNQIGTEGLEYPIVAKSIFGSRGEGNTLLNTKEEYDLWTKGKDFNHYIFEKFHNYSLEFRLHISEEGCFYACRKALKKDCPENLKWRHHDDTCVWYTEQNADFRRPKNWDDIVADCVKALKAVGADVLSFDVKVQGATTGKKSKEREYQDYILIECNSASSMDNGKDEISICASKYIEEIPKILRRKALK